MSTAYERAKMDTEAVVKVLLANRASICAFSCFHNKMEVYGENKSCVEFPCVVEEFETFFKTLNSAHNVTAVITQQKSPNYATSTFKVVCVTKTPVNDERLKTVTKLDARIDLLKGEIDELTKEKDKTVKLFA